MSWFFNEKTIRVFFTKDSVGSVPVRNTFRMKNIQEVPKNIDQVTCPLTKALSINGIIFSHKIRVLGHIEECKASLFNAQMPSVKWDIIDWRTVFREEKKTSHICTKYTYPILQILQWNKALDFGKCDNFQKITWGYILLITKVKSFELNRSILEVLYPLQDVGSKVVISFCTPPADHLPTPASPSISHHRSATTISIWQLSRDFPDLSTEAARGRHCSDWCNGCFDILPREHIHLLWIASESISQFETKIRLWTHHPFFSFVNQMDSKQINLQTETNISINTVN